MRKDRLKAAPRRRVLITGASSGIGAGLAQVYALRGDDVVITARRIERLVALRDQLERDPRVSGRIIVAGLDVTDEAAVQATFDSASNTLGSIDRVIVNAGIGKGARLGTGGLRHNQQTLETNVIGVLIQCEVALRHFYAQGHGHLVVMSSASAVRGQPGAMNAYAASKAAVAALAEGVRADLQRDAQERIRVTTLFPGKISSEMTERAGLTRHVVSNAKGCAALASAIDSEAHAAFVPRWPWAVIGHGMRYAPLRWVNRFFA